MAITPSMPSDLERISLKNLRGYNRSFGVEITKSEVKVEYGGVTLAANYKNGDTLRVDFNAGTIAKE